MRRSFNWGSLALFSIMGIWMTVQGCRSVATPTFPATSTPTMTNTLPVPTNTRTFTPTFTNTGTNTNTRTPTNTFTATFTPTVTNTPTFTNTSGGPTDTFTNTPTDTSTFTITDTPTFTGTPTNTFTPTNTLACNTNYQTSFTFDTCGQGWVLDASIGGEVVGFSAVTYHTASGAWMATIPFSAGSNAEEIGFYPPYDATNLVSASITMWVYSTVAGNAQMFVNSNAYAGYENPGVCGGCGNYVTLPANTWTMVYLNPTFAGGGENGAKVDKFGVNVLNITAPATVYLDDVSITFPSGPTNTPTFTPTPVQTWNFEDSTAQGWVTAGGNVGGVTFAIDAPGDVSPLYCFDMYAPFNNNNQSAGIAQSFGSPLNLTNGGVRCWMWLDSGTVTGGFPGGQIFMSDGTNAPYYGYYHNLTQGAWNQLDLPVATIIGAGPFNPANVTQITIQASTGGGGTAAAGHVKIDDIEAY